MIRTTIWAALLAVGLAGCGQAGQPQSHGDAGQAPATDAHAHGHEAATADHAPGEAAHAADGVHVMQPWSREVPPGAPVAAGFMTIHNMGSTDDRLVAVRSDAAGRVEIHEVRHEDGVARMRELADGLPLPAGASVELAPGGYHLMFIAPEGAFTAGSTVAATLVFAEAGEQQVELEVRGASAAPEEDAHHHH